VTVLLALGLLLAAPALAAASGLIRVAVVERARQVELRGTAIEVTELPACERCPRRSWRLEAVRASAIARGVDIGEHQAPGFRLRSGAPIRLNGREYPGSLEVLSNGDGLAVVNELPLEDYLAGVLRAEVPDRWPLEALRAQAIVARTYAAYHRLLNAGKPYHIVASAIHQHYAGLVPLSSPAWGAVRETAGQVLRWEGEVFPAYYHAESGGYTEDPRTVFNARNVPALRPVRCEFSAGSPHFFWSLDLKLTQISGILQRHGLDVGTVTAIEVAERTASLRATQLVIHGSRGSARLRGNDFRRMIGYDTLRSTLFAVAVDGETARFAGRGWGHGAGMCQWGARAMAEQGHTARQILEFYYPGAVLGALDGR
jgi:stage II sporulation protein D